MYLEDPLQSTVGGMAVAVPGELAGNCETVVNLLTIFVLTI